MDRLATSSADKKLFFSRLAFYEEGEQTGRLLPKIVQLNQTFPAIHNHKGRVVNDPAVIMQELVEFYSDLYRSRQDYTSEELQDFLQEIELPCLSASERQLLDSP